MCAKPASAVLRFRWGKCVEHQQLRGRNTEPLGDEADVFEADVSFLLVAASVVDGVWKWSTSRSNPPARSS